MTNQNELLLKRGKNMANGRNVDMFEQITHFIFRENIKQYISVISTILSLILFFTLIYFIYFK